ncbi:MAG TPA: DUF4783 domain-containing protein [Bacteroidales bacterium]|nr:DUF4783 domain-containing protein [Bacteroidales bacterium]
MNKTLVLIISSVVITAAVAFTLINQDANSVIKKVSIALQTGDAKELSKYFTKTVELEIMGEENFYSVAQAEILLKSFFEKSIPTAFKINHQGVKDVSSFAIGTLTVKTGNLRVSFFMKTENNQTLIHQLRIEQNEGGLDD